MQVEWNEAAKSKAKPLTEVARRLRGEAKRGLLAAFAPTMIINDWVEELTEGVEPGPVQSPVELVDLHPVAAEGILAWLSDRRAGVPRDVTLALQPYFAAIQRRASSS
jgi:hypothetical protein